MSQFILSAFGDEISPHLDEQIGVMLANDVHFLEFRSMEGRGIIDYPLPEVRAAHKKLVDAGMAVSAVGSPIGKIGIKDDFGPHLERFKQTIEVAHALETKYIRMFSFFIPHGDDPASYRDEVLKRWTSFVEASKGSGLILLHENEKDIYGDTAERCLDLLETLACDYVKATFDPANFVQCQVETYPHAFNLLRKHTVYLHIKDARYQDGGVTPAGEGEGKLPEILAALHQDGFEGFASIEPHLAHSLPGGGPELFGVAASALKKLLSRLP
ncbi:MAG: sugar phosphate isomerase/epimerase family protein [Chloroflexota bacterium]